MESLASEDYSPETMDFKSASTPSCEATDDSEPNAMDDQGPSIRAQPFSYA